MLDPGFEKSPPKASFFLEVNKAQAEILLSKEEAAAVPLKKTFSKPRSGNRSTKGSDQNRGVEGVNVTNITATSPALDSSRLEALEMKVMGLQRRQTATENKFDSRFDSMKDQLDMILHAVAPNTAVRPREPQLGSSPPSKHTKVGPQA